MNCHEFYDNTEKLLPHELDAWERRFDEAERVMGKEAADALKRLYDYYGKDFLVWLTKLYDPATGCFYYSNSARDNEGFLPDCESTAQVHNLFLFTGMLSRYDRDLSRALPAKTVTRCLEYVKSLQSPEDGYFYHPQWGNKITSSRRGRDFAQCLGIINSMGGVPDYLTANERLRATSAEYEDSRAELPWYLRSEKNMRAWLDNLKLACTDNSTGMLESSSFCHAVSSVVQGGQVKAAGLLDVVCDFLDELQEYEVDFWENGATFNLMSSVVKIGEVYGCAGRTVKYAERIVESCINGILADKGNEHVCLVSTPHSALSTAIGALIKINEDCARRGETEPYDIDVLRRLIYAKFPLIVDKTIEGLENFRYSDGSFSYLHGRCAAVTQSTEVAMKCKEGEVNGTACAVHYLLSSVFFYLGINVVPLASPADFEVLRKMIDDAEPIVKIPKEIPFRYFEDFGSNGPSWRSERTGKDHTDIVYDPVKSDRRVYKWIVEEGCNASYAFNGKEFLNPPEFITCFEFECEFFVSLATERGDAYTLTIESDDDEVAYTAVLSIEDGEVILYDTGEYGNPACTDRIVSLGRVGEWIRLTFFYYPQEHGAKIRVYRDGMCVKVSENYNGSFYMNAEPVRYVTKGRFTKVCPERAVLLLDKFKTRLYTDRYFGK